LDLKTYLYKEPQYLDNSKNYKRIKRHLILWKINLKNEKK
jgi:hypothetical protein